MTIPPQGKGLSLWGSLVFVVFSEYTLEVEVRP